MFNAEKVTNEIIDFIRDYYRKNNLKGAVLGISGGKDSAVVAAIMVKALGNEKVVGLTLPCHSKDRDALLAKKISEFYNFKLLNIDLSNTFDMFKDEVLKQGDFLDNELKNSDINLKPRLRMSACYYMASLFSALNGGTYIVIGTSNKCELYVGYFTKGGDSVHDIAPIADLTVEEVIKVGEYLNVPSEVLYRTPDDGISNQSDEEKLGVSYKDIAAYIEEKELPEEVSNKIKKLHNNSLHKFNIPTYRKKE